MAVSELVSASFTLVYVHLCGLISLVQADDCLTTVGWVRPHIFEYTSINNDCVGSRYTTTYKVKNITFHVAALLCTPTRYKLLIKDASDPKGRYRDIGDSYGNGEDHCELVGMDMNYRSDIKLGSHPKSRAKHGIGYYRDGWGKPFRRGRITFTPQWYECGISIPSSHKVYGCKDKEEEKFDYVRAAGLAVAVVIGGIVGSLIGFACLIYLTLRCIVDGVPYIQTKLCAWTEDEPHVSPDVLRSARPARSAMNQRPAPLSYLAPSLTHLPPLRSPTAPLAGESPSAPPRTPPWGLSASATPSRAREDAPPTYEEAENYPLVRSAEPEAEPPPYKDHASYKVHYTSF